MTYPDPHAHEPITVGDSFVLPSHQRSFATVSKHKRLARRASFYLSILLIPLLCRYEVAVMHADDLTSDARVLSSSGTAQGMATLPLTKSANEASRRSRQCR